MTCRYAHKRVAVLFTVFQETPAARVLEWPQPSQTQAVEKRERETTETTKLEEEESYARH